MELKFLRLHHVMDKTGLSRQTIYRMIEIGEFPQTIKISAHAVGWISTEVDEWMADKLANR